jgi:hypothetical protein
MKEEHEYIETSIWYREEIKDPYQIFAEYFSGADLVSQKKTVKTALNAAGSNHIWNKRNPGDLIYSFGQLESVINAAYLINKEKKKSPLSIENDSLHDPNLYRGWIGGLTDWDYFPRILSLKQYKDPYVVFKRFFKSQSLAEWKSDLRAISEYALVMTSLSETGIHMDTLAVYIYLTKLIEAAHLIDVREVTHIEGYIKNRLGKIHP